MRCSNGFLAAFGPEIALVRPHLREVTLKAGQVICEPGERINKVFFLNGGLVSKLTVFEDGTEIECALVGREGAVGALSALGLRRSVTRDVCHMAATASVIDATRLADAAQKSARIHAVLDAYCAWKMTYAIRNGACNAVHPVEHRLCRWLLTCADVLEGDEIRLPQEVFAKMLGVQRTSVNPILQRLRAERLIALGRSRLVVLDRERLMDRACECYKSMGRLDLKAVAHPHDEPAEVAPLRAFGSRC
jgi:CRP-like cAMP-binding protein